MRRSSVSQKAEDLREACEKSDVNKIREIIGSASNDKDKRDLLDVKNDKGQTVLVSAARLTSKEALLCILELVPKNYILEVMKTKTNLDSTPLHLAAINKRTDAVCVKMVEFLMEAYQKDGHSDSLAELLLAQNEFGRVFLHLVAKIRSNETLNRVLSTIPSNILVPLLVIRDTEGATILHYAALNSIHPDVIVTILKQLRGNLSSNDFDDMLWKTDIRGHTFLHWVAMEGTVDLAKNIKSILPQEKAWHLAEVKDYEDQNAFELSTDPSVKDVIDQFCPSDNTSA